jgi:hypothetical protein
VWSLAKRSKRGLARNVRDAKYASGRDPPPDQRSEVDAEASPPGVYIGPRVALPGAPIRFLRTTYSLGRRASQGVNQWLSVIVPR